jgi:hypothetical protein
MALSASTSESHYTSHACQICQPTNGRAGWPANFCIKEGRSGSEHSFNALIKKRHIKKLIAIGTSKQEE